MNKEPSSKKPPPPESLDVRTELDTIYNSVTKSRTDMLFMYFGRIIAIFAVPILTAVVFYVVNLSDRVVDNGHRIDIIERTRFTAEMGHAMEARIIKFIEERYPPDWLRMAVQRLEQKVDGNGEKIDELKERIIRLEERK